MRYSPLHCSINEIIKITLFLAYKISLWLSQLLLMVIFSATGTGYVLLRHIDPRMFDVVDYQPEGVNHTCKVLSKSFTSNIIRGRPELAHPGGLLDSVEKSGVVVEVVGTLLALFARHFFCPALKPNF